MESIYTALDAMERWRGSLKYSGGWDDSEPLTMICEDAIRNCCRTCNRLIRLINLRFGQASKLLNYSRERDALDRAVDL